MPILTNTTGMLGWAFQTSVLSNIKPNAAFLKGLFFGGREENLPTEVAELSYLEGHQQMAPFVEVNAEAVSVQGHSVRFANVATPNIRIKRPMEAYTVMQNRLPGTGMFITGGDAVVAARLAAIAEDAKTLADMIERREEWMASELLTGATAATMDLSYQVAERANFRVRYPRSTTMVAAAGTAWDTSTDIDGDFHRAKRAMSKYQQLVPTHCIMDSQTASRFMKNATVRSLMDNRRINPGDLQLANQFNESGAIPLGTFCGISCWEYSGEYTNDSGVSTAFMPTGVALFLHCSPSNEAKFLYGAIPDHGAFESGNFVGKRFAKTFKTDDPSTLVQLLQSRPMPLIRRPGAVYRLSGV
jgi:hypothetical protein